MFHQYVIRLPPTPPGRAGIQSRLRDAGNGTGIHYPMPVHLQPAYQGRVALGPAGCQASGTAANEVLSLPMYPEMTDEQVERVCAALRSR